MGAAGYFGYKSEKAKQAKSDSKRQAVFLTSGQVYFGYISGKEKPTVILRDIYYLKADNKSDQSNSQDQSKPSLVKLGNELHGPEDIMYINRDQILFYENMRDDSEINQLIQKIR